MIQTLGHAVNSSWKDEIYDEETGQIIMFMLLKEFIGNTHLFT